MRIGVIGAAGKIGQMRVKSIRDNPETELAAVLDLSLDAARAQAGTAPAFDELAPFLEVPMEAVVISTPAHVREALCLAAFERGLHVLAEKPLAHELGACRHIVDAARKARRHLGAGFNMRYYPAFAAARDAVESGQIGQLDHLRVYGGHEGLTKFVHDWEYKSEISGGGALWDVGIHMTDMTRHFLGEITEVYGIATNRVWNVPGSEDNAMAIFKSPGGVAARYQATWTDWTGYSSVIEAYGDRGMVRAAYAPMQSLLVTMDRPGGPVRRQVRRYRGIQIREKLFSWKTTAAASFAAELADFVALTAGREDLRIADGHAALRAVEVATAVAASSQSGAPVSLQDLGPMRF